MSRRAVVLGAGIQGCCAALALRHAGWSVTLVDGAPGPLQRTSLRGEGKLHLGYVYANDHTGATAALMTDGGLTFSELIDRWMPAPLPWTALRSTPFVYGVLDGTMLPADALADHYASVDAAVAERMAGGASYAGSTAFAPTTRLGDPAAAGFGPAVGAAFASSEVALQPQRLREHMIAGLRAEAVVFEGNTIVHGVERLPQGFAVSCTDARGAGVERRADLVVNCLWYGRLAVDATMGVSPGRAWSYRLKYGIHGHLAESEMAFSSTTLALGPFGDVVAYQGGQLYASWYPTCMTAWSADATIPTDWAPAMAGEDAPARRDEIVRRTLDAFAAILPAIRGFVVDSVAAGVVVAWGDSDIDDPGSELHRRSEIGVHDHDGYVSIDTGKLTTAPLFADRLVGLLGR